MYRLQSWVALELERASRSHLGGWGQGVCGWSQQSDQHMSLFEFQEPVPLSDGGVGDLGRWGAMMLTSKWCGELEGTRPTLVCRMGCTVSTCGFEVCPGLQEPQSPHPAVCAVPTSSGANRIAVLFWWLPIPLPWHSWGLSQCPNQEC